MRQPGMSSRATLLLEHEIVEATRLREDRRAVDTPPGNLTTAVSGSDRAFAVARHAHRNRAEFQARFDRRFTMNTLLPRPLPWEPRRGPNACFGLPGLLADQEAR
ncbi:hypothetical protein BURK1_01626 [Burkholderiales bacterium]|nr:hypothetical protein BURK1_01626 [Burkholderiales bacterium]